MVKNNAESIIEAAMQLSFEERVLIAERIWCSLDEAHQDRVSRQHIEESERRLKAWRDGTSELLDGEPILARMREGKRP